jgi:hypothetical protein
MDAAERELLSATVREAVDAAATRGAGTGGASAATLDTVLGDLGWLEMLDAEPRDALAAVFHALGAGNGTASPLDDVLVGALGHKPRPGLAVLLPPYGAWDPPGHRDGEHTSAAGLATSRIASADDLLVVSKAGAGLVAVTVPVSAATVAPIRGIDPAAGFHAVRVDHDSVHAPLDGPAWDGAIALGRRAVAHEMAGASRTMLDLARTHALERVQFGRPIAGFQAVRHRLAEALVAVEALEAALTAAGDDVNSTTAALAKAVAGRTARTVGAHCQQVLAGIGFTTDHPFHRYLKRTMLLDGILGSADDLTVDLGRRLLATRTVPTLIEL